MKHDPDHHEERAISMAAVDHTEPLLMALRGIEEESGIDIEPPRTAPRLKEERTQ